MSTRIPSLNWLRVFEAAARCESFARAAGQLGMSSAAVSQQVKALEDRLGTPLFLRHAHAVSLTEAGRAYLPVVQQSLMMLESATTGLFGVSREERLYVHSVLLFAQGVLSKGLSEFRDLHPNISLMLSTGVSGQDYSGTFSDMQIIFGNPRLYGAESDRLMGEVLYPVARPDLAQLIRSPQDLLAHPLIEVASHRAGWSHVFEALRLPQGGSRQIFADSTIMATALAAQGLGVALARAPASDLEMRAHGLVRLFDTDLQVTGTEAYHLVYPDRATLRPAARRFRSWLLDFMAQDRN